MLRCLCWLGCPVCKLCCLRCSFRSVVFLLFLPLPGSAHPLHQMSTEMEARISRIEDGLSEWTATTRTRWEGLTTLNQRMCDLYKNKGGMWHVKKELFDLVFNDLDHALGSMEDIAPAGGQYWPYSPNDDDDDVPNGLAAISKVPAAGWGQILAYMAFCEVSQDQSPGTPAAAGDFGFKVLTSSDPAEKTKKLSAELANGRLAMIAIIGMFFQAQSQPIEHVPHNSSLHTHVA